MTGWVENSKRREELAAVGKDRTAGPNWYWLRGHVKKRAGGICEAARGDGTRCTEVGTDCDHVGDRNVHEPSNLQWLCKVHHGMKTQAEAAAARRATAATFKHPGERHPSGLRFY